VLTGARCAGAADGAAVRLQASAAAALIPLAACVGRAPEAAERLQRWLGALPAEASAALPRGLVARLSNGSLMAL
jgi:hypothetical protein